MGDPADIDWVPDPGFRGAGDWLVIGWFTPDYRPLADKFSANLREVKAPHHLFAKAKVLTLDVRQQKPTVVLEAMDRFPGRMLVLMDTDCIVRSDMEPVTRINADVGLSFKARLSRVGRSWHKRIVVTLGSRVVVFSATPGARTFAEEWERQCRKNPSLGDETNMGWAFLLHPNLVYQQVDPRYTGWEVDVPGAPEGTVVWHHSEHDRAKSPIKRALKHFERRYFRNGRTKSGLDAVR